MTFLFSSCIIYTNQYLPQFYSKPLTHFLRISWPLLHHLHDLSPIYLSLNCKAIRSVCTITDTILKGSRESQVFSSLPWWPPSNLPVCLTLTPFLASTWCYWPLDVPPWLCRAEAGTFPGADALIPEFSTTGVSKIKAFGEFTAMMFFHSWQTLGQKQKKLFNTEMQNLRKQLLSLKTELTNESAKHIIVISHLAPRWALCTFQVIHFLNFSLTGKLIWFNSTSSKRENPVVPLPLLPFCSSPAFSSVILSFSLKLAGEHSWASESAHQTIRKWTQQQKGNRFHVKLVRKVRESFISTRDLLSFFTLLFIFIPIYVCIMLKRFLYCIYLSLIGHLTLWFLHFFQEQSGAQPLHI